mgnify:CR=1 FL=1
MIEQKIEQNKGFMVKARNFVRGKAALYALSAALTLGAASCGGEEAPECDPQKSYNNEYNYCVDYAGKEQCYDGERCICREEDEYTCECGCERTDSTPIDKGY